MAEPRSRIDVPADPRDVPGNFAHRHEVEVRLSDTDAMGHVNNARYLTYVEIARVAYYERVTGDALPIGAHGAVDGMILAEIRMTYRSPAFFGETLTVETRVERIGRSSFGMAHRIGVGQADLDLVAMREVAGQVTSVGGGVDSGSGLGHGRTVRRAQRRRSAGLNVNPRATITP